MRRKRDPKGRVGFAVGTGRCGTTFLYQAIRLESDVASVHERNPINESFQRYCKWYQLPVDNEGFRSTKLAEIQADLTDHSFSFESSGYLSLAIQELYDLCEAKFVLLVRSPERVVNSYLRKGWYENRPLRSNPNLATGYQPGRQAHHFLSRIMPSGDKFVAWNEMSRVGQLAWYWNALNAEVIGQFENIPQTHCRVERLEDLSYDRYLEIASFLGYEATVARVDYEKLVRHRPNAQSNIRSSSNWNSSEVNEFESEVSPMAQRFGYEFNIEKLIAAESDRPLAESVNTTHDNVPGRHLPTFKSLRKRIAQVIPARRQ